VSDRLEIHIVSDSTGDTAARVGRAAQSQFVDTEVEMIRHARVQTREQLARALESATNRRAAVFYTLVDPMLRETIVELAREHNLVLYDPQGPHVALPTDVIDNTPVPPLTWIDYAKFQYFRRIAAIEFAVKHDDGLSADDLHNADVILVGVSRSGKTPTSLYLALQFGVKAANYPLIPEDFQRMQLPEALRTQKTKLYGLTIAPERLHEIRQERRPDSRYANLDNCRFEIEEAAKLMRREGIRSINSTSKSIEEIATTILRELRIPRHVY